MNTRTYTKVVEVMAINRVELALEQLMELVYKGMVYELTESLLFTDEEIDAIIYTLLLRQAEHYKIKGEDK